ncbi:MAG TPA: helix-turn-helix domain-containing protein [Candidatus Dormibacteraeota bacterium]|nr:helix-turn-helix domain-containing protein [Candidatus Dormibacteraeota bacterium]
MKEDSITLSTQEQRRLMVLNQLGSGLLSSEQASNLLGISERQLRRVRRRYREQGAKALAHGNRGRSPANASRRPFASKSSSSPPAVTRASISSI